MNELNSIVVKGIKHVFDEKISFYESDDLSIICREPRKSDGNNVNGYVAHVSIEIDKEIYREHTSASENAKSEIDEILISHILCQLLQYNKNSIGSYAMQIKVDSNVIK
jgi:hypothetical protein